MNLKLHVNIKDRSSVLFDGEADAVSTYNDLGLFDVLPMHQNFITLIKNKVTVHAKGMPKKEIKLDSGLLKSRGNKVNIYLGV